MLNSLLKNKIHIIAGHYGSGKTNVSVNLAYHFAKKGLPVTMIDFDTVNPYFRAADSVEKLSKIGVKCIIPEFANSNVDVPSLPADIFSVFISDSYTFFDVGGDDAGATALGAYAKKIIDSTYQMHYVVNMYRPLTSTPEEAFQIMREIETRTGLYFTDIINNSNIGQETSKENIEDSFEYAKELSSISSLPLLFTSYRSDLFESSPVENESFGMFNATENIF